MRIKLFVLAGAVFAIIGRVGAGSMELAPKETAPPTITQSEPWQFTIAAPGWLASMNGTIGVHGINADIDVPVDEVLQHLDMIFAMRAEAQKGPFGIYGELIYIGLSDGAQINGLINNIHEQVDQYLVDGALSWRLINQPHDSSTTSPTICVAGWIRTFPTANFLKRSRAPSRQILSTG